MVNSLPTKISIKLKNFLTLLLPLVLIAGLFTPLLQLNQPSRAVLEGPAHFLVVPEDKNSDIHIAIGSFGLLGLDTVVNTISGSFEQMGAFARGVAQIRACVNMWGGHGNTVLAFFLCPWIIMLNGLASATVNLIERIFTVRIFMGQTGEVLQAVHQQATMVANILFVLVLLLIIISMITSVGLSNYHLKKMAPKIAIVAVTVNMSFFITGALVDLSNITGHSVKNMVATAARAGISAYDCDRFVGGIGGDVEECIEFGGPTHAQMVEYNSQGALSDPDALAYGVAGAAGVGTAAGTAAAVGGTAAVGSMFKLIAITLAVLAILLLINVIMIIILSSVRIAILMGLVIVSPLAFVAIIFPNGGQKLFMRWFSEFGKLLLIFPMFGLVVGVSQIAASMFMRMGNEDLLLSTVGMFVAILIPMFAAKSMLKNCSQLMAQASSKVSGAIAGIAMAGAVVATGGAALAGKASMMGAAGSMMKKAGIAPGIGDYMENKGKKDLQKGKKTGQAKAAAKQEQYNLQKQRNEEIGSAELSGDENRIAAATDKWHQYDVGEATKKLSDDEKAVMDTINNDKASDAEKHAAWNEFNRMGLGHSDAGTSMMNADGLTSAAEMAKMGRQQRAAAVAKNKAIADFYKQKYGDNVVSGATYAQMVQGTAPGVEGGKWTEESLTSQMKSDWGKASALDRAADGRGQQWMNSNSGVSDVDMGSMKKGGGGMASTGSSAGDRLHEEAALEEAHRKNKMGNEIASDKSGTLEANLSGGGDPDIQAAIRGEKRAQQTRLDVQNKKKGSGGS